MPETDWRQKKYDQVFRSCFSSLDRQRRLDPAFNPATARGVLEHLYIQEGNDQSGRGEVQDIQIQASIAAYERFLADWEAES